MTAVTGTVSINVLNKGLLLMIDNDEKLGSSTEAFSIRTRERTPYPMYDKNEQNQDLIYDH